MSPTERKGKKRRGREGLPYSRERGRIGVKTRTTDFDGSLQLQKDRLVDEDLARLGT
jgi:hypothetical protein